MYDSVTETGASSDRLVFRLPEVGMTASLLAEYFGQRMAPASTQLGALRDGNPLPQIPLKFRSPNSKV
jgi:hypothetical protein